MPKKDSSIRMTIDHFERVAKRTRMTEESLDVARQVLVDGRRQSDIAKEAKVSRQWVYKAVAKMIRYATASTDIPEGWKSGIVVLPSGMWRQVRTMEREARKTLENGPQKSTRTSDE
jgi:hypothetical protein